LELINRLILDSKASWGYSPQFMEKAKADLEISLEEFQNTALQLYTFSIEKETLGVLGIRNTEDIMELEYFFLDPRHLKKGLGRKMWEESLKLLKAQNCDFFLICSDPFAAGFYEKMGALRVGSLPSPVQEDRHLPLYLYLINESLKAEEILEKLRMKSVR